MVEGTMELHTLLGLAQRLRGRSAEAAGRYPANLKTLTPDHFRRFGEQFMKETRVFRSGETPYFIDKMPNNFLHIGLIRLILPNARSLMRGVIRCRAVSLDTSSCLERDRTFSLGRICSTPPK
jgi:hypothetical protein